MFGPKTQQAYQNWQGQNNGYSYEGNPLTNAANNEGLDGSTPPVFGPNPEEAAGNQPIFPGLAAFGDKVEEFGNNQIQGIKDQDALEEATGNKWGALGDIYQSLPGVGDNPGVIQAWGDRFKKGSW